MKGPSAGRVAARVVADLDPPLGYPGGPCHVIDRVRSEVRNPRLREEIVDDIERGLDLTNPEAATVYTVEVERPPSGARFDKLLIGPHAAYRMDLRGITVPQIRAALTSLAKTWNDLRSQRHPLAARWDGALRGRGKIEWVDPRLNLMIVVAPEGRDLKLVTTYWQGDPDPRPPGEGGCDRPRMAYDPSEDSPGVKTLVKPEGDDREKERALPPGAATPQVPKKEDAAPGGGRDLPSGQYSKPDETTKVTERPRSLPTPGEEYGHPTKFDYNYIRRRDMNAATEVEGYRQRVPWTRQRRQRVFKKNDDKRYYKSNRTRINRRVQRWYRTVRRNPMFQNLREKRRKNPSKYQRRLAQIGLDLPIAFGRGLQPGTVLRVDPGGSVVFRLDGIADERALPASVFLASATFLDEDDIEVVFDALDEMDTDYPDASVDELRAFADRAGLDPDSATFLARVTDITGRTSLADLTADDVDAVEEAILDGEIMPPIAKAAYTPTSLSFRRYRQRGRARVHRHRSYMRNRAKAHRQGHLWYRKNRRRPQFKRRQVMRRRNPQRFRLRRAGVEDVAFVVGPDMLLGSVVSVSPVTGLVEVAVHTDDQGDLSYWLSPLAFLSSVVFLSDLDLHSAMALIDAALGPDAYDTIDVEDVPELSKMLGIDEATLTAAVTGESPVDALAALVEAQHPEDDEVSVTAGDVILYDQRPPGDLPDNWTEREDTKDDSTERSEPNRPYRETGPGQWTRTGPKQTRKPTPGGVTEGPDRTLPGGSGKVIPEHLKHAKTAAKIADILAGTEQIIHDRSKKRAVHVRRADPDRGIWTFDVTGGTKPYRVRVKGLKRGNIKQMRAMDVEVSCTCPFYRWQGPEHWGVAEGYMYGKPQGTASFPHIRDPERRHLTCKHAILALNLALKYRVASGPSAERIASRVVSTDRR